MAVSITLMLVYRTLCCVAIGESTPTSLMTNSIVVVKQSV